MTYSSLGATGYYTIPQLSSAIINKVINFDPGIGFKLEMLIPNSLQPQLVTLVGVILERNVKDSTELKEINTDTLGYEIAKELGEWMALHEYMFTMTPDDDVWSVRTGYMWAIAIGASSSTPGMLSTLISNTMEDIIQDTIGIDPITEDTSDTDWGGPNLIVIEPQNYVVPPSPSGPSEPFRIFQPGQKILGIPMNILLIAGAGVGALILLKKRK